MEHGKMNIDNGFSCAVPITEYPNIMLAHGGGGKLMHQLIEKIFIQAFKNPVLDERHDGAVINLNVKGHSRLPLVLTTDSYVVYPLFFPGGNIGTLAVNGTVNDLAMCGARPLYLSVGFILEEGLPMETLWKVVQSMQQAAEAAQIQLVTGDTKVVDKGKGDGIFINTTGIGIIEHELYIGPASIRPGDVILLNGDIGRHGIAIMAVREEFEFESTIETDSAPVASLVMELLGAGIEVHCMRDLTRGGLAGVLVEIAQTAHLHISIEEKAIPIREDVQAACEILGFDPLYVASEGRFISFIPASEADRALNIMHTHPLGKEACPIGNVEIQHSTSSGIVTMKSRIGAKRILDMLSGEQLPRIC